MYYFSLFVLSEETNKQLYMTQHFDFLCSSLKKRKGTEKKRLADDMSFVLAFEKFGKLSITKKNSEILWNLPLMPAIAFCASYS